MCFGRFVESLWTVESVEISHRAKSVNKTAWSHKAQGLNMSGPYAGPGNDPFRGGSHQRLNPPSGGTFGIPPPSGGGGGSLASNAAGGDASFARNNRGSNISIPYARVVRIATVEISRGDR